MFRQVHGFPKVLLMTACALVGFVVMALIALYFLISSPVPMNLVGKYGMKYIDGNLDISDIRVRGVRNVTVNVDSLRLTYPHDRFSAYDIVDGGDCLLDSGRGSEVDTLLSVDNITIRANVWNLIRMKRFRVPLVKLVNARAFIHRYDDTLSNLSILRFGSEPVDSTLKEPMDLILSLGHLEATGHTNLVYTDQCDTLYAGAEFDSLGVRGRVRIFPGQFRLRNADLTTDGLKLHGRVPEGVLDMDVSELGVYEESDNVYDVKFVSKIKSEISVIGRIDLPLGIDAILGMEREDTCRSLSIEKLDASIANVPLHVDGGVKLYGDSTYVDILANVKDFPMGVALDRAAGMFPDLPFWTDGFLSIDAKARGMYSDHSIPEMNAYVRMPEGNVRYLTRGINGRMNLDLDASITPDRYLTADVHNLKLTGTTFNLALDGRGSNILGKNPAVDASLVLDADLKPLLDSLNLGLPVAASGKVKLDVDGKFKLSDIKDLAFDRMKLSGHLNSDRLLLRMPKDSIRISTYNPDIRLQSGKSGVELDFAMDSLFAIKGRRMALRLKETDNTASMTKIETADGVAPRLSLRTDNERVFYKVGSSRIMGRDICLDVSASQRILTHHARNRRIKKFSDPDSTGSFRGRGDVDISLDSTFSTYLKDWRLNADVAIGRGSFSSPKMPLRTRMSDIHGRFDGRDLVIDTMGVVCGTSDLGLSGYAKGFGPALVRKAFLDIDAKINSNKLNLNEIVEAFNIGVDKSESKDADVEDESFVVDSLTGVVPDLPPMEKMIIVPANMQVNLGMNVKQGEFLYFNMDSIRANAVMKDRIIQLTDSGLRSDFANVDLDAFYSSQSTSDFSAGTNLKLTRINAENIIRVMPQIDTLMPALKSFKGNFDCNLSATLQIDSNMNVIKPSVDGLLKIDGKDLFFDDIGNLRTFTTLLLFKDKNIGHVDDFHAYAVAHNSKVEVFPFQLTVDRYKLALWGMHGFDNNMYYHVTILKGPLISRFGFNIYGTPKKWKFGLSKARFDESNLPTFTTEFDAMQLNISDYVRNILRTGSNDILEYNKKSHASLDRSKATKSYSVMNEADVMSPKEFRAVDSELYQYETAMENAELTSEVDRIIEMTYHDTSKQIEKYMLHYQLEMYKNGMKEKIEKLNRKAAGKKK